MVPKIMTQLLQPVDHTLNGGLRKYFRSSIMKELKNDPICDVTTIKVDLQLSILKPLHEVMRNAFDYFVSCRGKEIMKAGRKIAGATFAIHGTCS